ncbi:N-acetyltransferase [Streptomyces canarius]|uniref:N-acetyltransferase n=1 Tax=Streptomyces canarius TaxID=285453 RepID=A0ABQ3CUP1_9ACTN|nr:N-acetyltransferase [Streptomyces canarius]
MEISAKGRLEVRITPADVGKRVSVRRLGEPGGGPEKFTDTVGVLTSWDGGVLMITRRDGERVRIPQSALVAGKVVPAAPARRRGPAATYPELVRVSSRAWRPVESERLGEWELRAAGGFTRRANSVLPLGDPGLPLDAALAAVRRWYGERGLPAYAQTATGAEGTQEMLCAELERRGWVREVTAELWTGALAPVADRAGGAGVVLSRAADEAWLARYQRKGVSEVALRVLGSGPSVWFASVPGAGEGEPPAAIGRCVVDGRWAGFAAVEVDPGRRRQGLATEVMAALARRALEEGASAAWLQVETDNDSARALYRALGFTPHHAYHHYRAPEEQDLPEQPPATADRPSPADTPETRPLPEDAPETGPLPKGTPETESLPTGTPETRPRPEGTQETEPLPEDSPETRSLPGDNPETPDPGK